MRTFVAYTDSLQGLTSDFLAKGRIPSVQQRLHAALNGDAAAAVRSALPLSTRRKLGAFFTGSELANKLVAPYIASLSSYEQILDPACGAGDLLVACAHHMPVASTLLRTLAQWGRIFIGCDVRADFIRAAKARLLLAALDRHSGITFGELPDPDDLFPNITVGDSFRTQFELPERSLILINPPYCSTTAPRTCTWGSGRVSNAALFMERYAASPLPGQQLAAILPDVLRTGARYNHWREHITSAWNLRGISIEGEFDAATDVDVFILRLTARTHKRIQAVSDWVRTTPTIGIRETVGDYFDIRVGSVVPHRDRQKGPTYPFIDASSAPRWTILKDIELDAERRFSGTVFIPPFVVVRRTSSPKDKDRIGATIITGKNDIAVENHLYVLTPQDGTVRTCRALMNMLHDQGTNHWLNRRIRCRHLTKDSIKEIPWRVSTQ